MRYYALYKRYSWLFGVLASVLAVALKIQWVAALSPVALVVACIVRGLLALNP